jgi:hypothetical protein
MIKSELLKAQQNLTEFKIRTFWSSLSQRFPDLCVQDGVVFDYKQKNNNKNMIKQIEHLATILMKCGSYGHVATPLFQYCYEPNNDTPHHATSLTLTKNEEIYIITLFNPKGKDSLRINNEKKMLEMLCAYMEQKYNIKVTYYLYKGKNLQNEDTIGLCQLYSLRYLLEYIVQIQRKQIRNVSDPEYIIQMIQKKDHGFDELSLYRFWKKFFP